jgi:hypothetical protein
MKMFVSSPADAMYCPLGDHARLLMRALWNTHPDTLSCKEEGPRHRENVGLIHRQIAPAVATPCRATRLLTSKDGTLNTSTLRPLSPVATIDESGEKAHVCTWPLQSTAPTSFRLSPPTSYRCSLPS